MSQTPAPEHGSGLEAVPALDPEIIASPPVGAGDEPAADHAAADQPTADPRAAEPAHADPPAPAVDLPATADPRVDDALSRLAEVEALPLAEQVAVYADIHRRLAGVLSDPDSQA